MTESIIVAHLLNEEDKKGVALRHVFEPRTYE